MQTAIVMIILTVLPGGDISSSFVNIDTRDECQTRLQRIEPILRNGKIEVKEAGCFRGEAQFDDFDHAPPEDAPRFSYLVSLQADRADVREMESPEACRDALPRQSPQHGLRHYCTLSTQGPKTTGN